MPKLEKMGKEEFVWKFHIPDISKIFKHVNNGVFKKIDEGVNVYVCGEEHHKLAEELQSDGLIEVYIPQKESLQAPDKRYEVEDGRFMLYENKPAVKNGEIIWKEVGIAVTDNFYMILREDITFDNGDEKIHRWIGDIITSSGLDFDFDIDATTFANANDLSKTLILIAGSKVQFDNNKFKDIRNAMIATSDTKSYKVSQVFGWESQNAYSTPSAGIVKSGVVDMKGEGKVDLSHIPIAKNLDIKKISDKDFKIVGDHIFSDLMFIHERYPIDCLFGHTFMAPIANRIVESEKYNGGRVGMWLVGGSGCGKTYAAMLFQNFFGNFGGSRSPFSWLGTPYSIQDGGYYFKDALFMVDDFKIAHFSKIALDSVVMILQNYADGTSRTRLGSDMNVSAGKPIRGSILVTGEDVLEDVGSVMGRYHVVHMDDQFKDRSHGKSARKCRGLYSGFMGRYISWLLNDANKINNIVDRIEIMKDEFAGDRHGANIDRVAQSFAYNLVGFEQFCEFSREKEFISIEKCAKMIQIHKNDLLDKIDKHVTSVREATVSEIFIATLTDLINSGAVKIMNAIEGKEIHDDQNEYVGFDTDDQFIYFYGSQVLSAVQKSLRGSSGRDLANSRTSLISELVQRNIMVAGPRGNVYRKKLFGKTIVTWRIYKTELGYEYDSELDRFVSNVDMDDIDGEDW